MQNKQLGIGDAKLVNSSNVIEDNAQNNIVNIETAESSTNNGEQITSSSSTSSDTQSSETENNISSTENQNNLDTQTTSASNYEAEYFVSSRLERDKMYSQMIETYQGMLESGTVSAEQKSISTQEITNINNKKNSIMIAENLIKNLGFEDVVIFVNEGSVSVIVKAEKLEEAEIAQIQNIVCREIGVGAEVIHISLK